MDSVLPEASVKYEAGLQLRAQCVGRNPCEVAQQRIHVEFTLLGASTPVLDDVKVP
jgi:hypothetical protein